MFMKTFQALTVSLTLTALSGTVAFAADAPAKAEKAKAYPLTTCVVSGEKLGEMGTAAAPA